MRYILRHDPRSICSVYYRIRQCVKSHVDTINYLFDIERLSTSFIPRLSNSLQGRKTEETTNYSSSIVVSTRPLGVDGPGVVVVGQPGRHSPVVVGCLTRRGWCWVRRQIVGMKTSYYFNLPHSGLRVPFFRPWSCYQIQDHRTSSKILLGTYDSYDLRVI